MTDQNLGRIRYVTSHFHHLQGLRWKVPLGLYLIDGQWDGSMSLWGYSKWFASFVYWARRLSPFILAIASPLYYRRRFGLVYRKAKAARYLPFLIGTLVVAAFVAVDFFNEYLFVRLVYLSVGGAFLGTWLRRGRPRLQEHYAVLGALLLGASMLDRSWDFNLERIVGTALILAGLLDHWQLLRTLKRPTDEPQTIAPAPMEKLR